MAEVACTDGEGCEAVGVANEAAEGALVWSMTERDFLEMGYSEARERCYRTRAGLQITPAWLMEMAERAEARYKELRFRFPAGTVHTERNLMRQLSEDALEVAAWMEARGVQQSMYAGPFGSALPKRGDKVLIRRGAVVSSTHPQVKSVELGRALRVTLHSVDRGYIDVRASMGGREERVRGPQVHWAGSGGYWRWTDAGNVVDEG